MVRRLNVEVTLYLDGVRRGLEPPLLADRITANIKGSREVVLIYTVLFIINL